MGKITADYIAICVGGRPNYLDIKNKHLAITSDDIFTRDHPGKTLVVGGGYIAVECAGFLSGLSVDTTLMTRGLFLRSFDQDIARQIVEDLKNLHEVKVKDGNLPISFEKTEDKRIKVVYEN